MRKLSVVPDLDEGERKLNKELYEELMAKREQGEKGWYIYKLKLCRNENFRIYE